MGKEHKVEGAHCTWGRSTRLKEHTVEGAHCTWGRSTRMKEHTARGEGAHGEEKRAEPSSQHAIYSCQG